MKLPNKYLIYTHLKGVKAHILVGLTHTRIESYILFHIFDGSQKNRFGFFFFFSEAI
jgi:hypothetical protein